MSTKKRGRKIADKSRKEKVFNAIVESFINDSVPVSSKKIQSNFIKNASEATIRNDMQSLEEEGLIESLHTSSGRVPTAKGFRKYVDMYKKNINFSIINKFKEIVINDLYKGSVDDMVYNAVTILSKYTNNIAFATIPSKKKAYYLGISNIIKTPEFLKDHNMISVIEILEDNISFLEKLSKMNITDKISVFIGNENIIPQMQSTSVIATKYYLYHKNEIGIIGIIGPMRMDYYYNIALLDVVRSKLSVYLLP